MSFRFEFIQKDYWPPTAWIAECVESDPVIRVQHGPQVETRGSWFCEAIWDGKFSAGDFDLTDLVFGSGARLRDGRVVFVSSGSTVDRLQFVNTTDKVLVSNSLACLLGVSGTRVVRTFDRYRDVFASIVRGIDLCVRRLPTESDTLELVYFRNLTWDGRRLAQEDKPVSARDFSTFTKYRAFLDSALERITANMRAIERRHRYEMVGTLSSGYDSVTAATLCRDAGMRKAISFQKGVFEEGGSGEDHGAEIAKILNIELSMFDRHSWRAKAFGEVPFIAANSRGIDLFFSAAENSLRGRVLVTGFHGDKVWDKHTRSLGPEIVRGDMSGLSLCEYRLLLGCIHFPLPFMGVQQIRDINALSNSAELAPWDVPGPYSRPICRAIVEQAGVPRGLFGTKKKMASVHLHHGYTLLSEATRAEYHRWLAAEKKEGVWAKCNSDEPKVPSKLVVISKQRFYWLNRVVGNLIGPQPEHVKKRVKKKMAALEVYLARRINLIDFMFPWATEIMANTYRERPNDNGPKISVEPSATSSEISNGRGAELPP